MKKEVINLATSQYCRLEALSVDNGRARLIVLLLGDPHLLECRKGSQDGSSNPNRVLALGGSNDLDLHGGGSKGSDLLLHAVSDAAEHGGSSRENDVAVKVLTDIDVALHDGVVGGLVDTSRLKTDEGRLEENLGAAEALVADGDDLSVGELVGLLDGGGLSGGLHLLLEVEGNVAELLLDVANDLTLGSSGEGVATLGEDLHHVVGEIAASQVETENGVGKSVALVDGHSVGNTVARIEHDTGGTTRGVEGEHSLDSDVHGGSVEGLEHNLGHLLSVGLGVEGSLGEENGVLLGGNTELVVEGVMPASINLHQRRFVQQNLRTGCPKYKQQEQRRNSNGKTLSPDLLHVVPVGHDTVLDGVLECQNTTLGLSLIADVPAETGSKRHFFSSNG
jgi:hypothetical protein